MVAVDKPSSITYSWPRQGEWTFEDYGRLPADGWRYEVIRGELHMSPAPTVAHQQVSIALAAALYNHVRERGLGRVFQAPIDVILPELATPVQPDIVLILAANLAIVQPAHIHGAPDLVVEILSPRTAAYDRQTKYVLYAEAGVTEYWIIDPETCSADLFTRRGNGFVPLGHYERDGVLRSELLPDLGIALSDVCFV